MKKAIIVGSGRGVRHLDFTRSYPTALEQVADKRNAMDWILSALERAGTREIAYVGGYHIQKIIERYPQVRYLFHSGWQQSGDAAALLLARDWLAQDCIVCRTDVLFLPSALEELLAVPDELAFGYCGDETKPGGTATRLEDGLLGLSAVRASAAGDLVAATERLVRQRPSATLEDWVRAISPAGTRAHRIDLNGHAASIHDRPGVARLVLGTKAQTLDRLRPLLRTATILDQVRFTVDEWRGSSAPIVARIGEAFAGRPVIVRSSSQAEDQWGSSAAGRFESVMDVPSGRPEALGQAVDTVIASFVAAGVETGASQLFVQEQISGTRASGVLFTRDPESGAPYYVLNIDRASARTDVVTSGGAGPIEKIVVLRRASDRGISPQVSRLLAAAAEIESLVFHDALDIEFAFGPDDELYVLQVRPLTTFGGSRQLALAAEDLEEEVKQVRVFVGELGLRKPGVSGSRTIFGVMPDWNPAEMIGIVPRPLALSLYQKLIGDHVWAAARARIGYRDVTPEPLIVSLAGRPYVDVRASLNSFLPADVPPALAGLLIEHQLDRLQGHPQLHDKIEFEIASTCFALDAEPLRLRLDGSRLGPDGVATLERSLTRLTDRMLLGLSPDIPGQLALTGELSPRREAVLRAVEGRPVALGWALHVLIEDCRRYGTHPFSILARYAFVAVAFLRELRRRGILSSEEHDTLLRHLPTVGTDLARDIAAHLRGVLGGEEFVRRYGHLRPSSYDIMSPNYGRAMELYLGGATDRHGSDAPPPDASRAGEILDAHAREIDGLLDAAGFEARTPLLRGFVLGAIPARERAKFAFTKTLDAILEVVARIVEQFGFDRNDASFLSVEKLARWATDSASIAARTELSRDIEYAKKRWSLTCSMQLPPVIRSPEEVEVFEVREALPNFVSRKRVVGPVVEIAAGRSSADLAGAIVLVESADPGYDWIFARPIAGLVTRYGGVASHMAIRAAEFSLPAAIGCGELIFERARQAKMLELDCESQQVRVIR